MKPRVLWFGSGKMSLQKYGALSRVFAVASASKARQLLARPWRYDVVICQSVKHLLIAKALMPSVPLVLENHGDLHKRPAIAASLACSGATCLRAVSRLTLRDFWEYVDPDSIYSTIIPPWVEREIFTQAVAWEDAPDKLVIYAGGPSEDKGQKMYEELRAHKELRMVNFMSIWQADRPVLASWLKAARLLIVPSEYESFGRLVLEGMFAEVPILAAPNGAIPELVRHMQTGLLAPKRVSTWARLVRGVVLGEIPVEGIVKRARKRAEAIWSESLFVDGHVRLVDEAMYAR